ncbi:hypothetical protein FSP39_015436 [Pinctada imbricata]|uniref:G-protein coupled receptors family 1 profile domain-containing protein n=1 Tax=Pinctada imbricata TaxID=66713 RepID=A0AA89BPT5_PINIB|nr:hypothetical protein FSP39_015436 [Pinctada imbricata]
MNSTTTEGVVHETGQFDRSTAPYFPDIGHMAIGGILAVIFIVGTFSNGVALLTFIKCKNLRTPTNTFIMSLLFGDFCMCSLPVPMVMAASFQKYWTFGKIMCDLEAFLVYFLGLTNMYTLCAISLDRYIVIALPLHASKITNRVAVISVLLCWIWGLFWASTPLLGWSYYHLEAAHTSCAIVWESDDPAIFSYNMTIFFVCYAFPVGVMLFAYFNVYMTIKNVARNNVWDLTSRIARKNLAIEKKMFKTILIMVGLFLLAWTPYAVVSFWATVVGSGGIPILIQTIPAIAAKSSSVANPFVYVATNKQFRKGFYSIIPCDSLRTQLEQTEEQKKEKSEDGEEKTVGQTQAVPITKVAPSPVDKDHDTQIEDMRASPVTQNE